MRSPRPPRRVVLPLMLAVLLVAAGCSGPDEQAGGGKVVKIGLIEALSGRNQAPGQGVRNAVELAIREANQRGAVRGWKLELLAKDAGDPESAAKAAAELAADPEVAGVLGTSSSSVSQATIPVLARAGLVQLAYSNTNPTLTLGPYATTAPRRVWGNFARLVANDLLQGNFAAQYAWDQLNARTVATVNDQKTYGLGLVSAFEGEWRNRGGSVTSSSAIKEGDRDFGDLVAAIIAQRPAFVYYGGEFEEASRLAAQLAANGYPGKFMGGDTLFTDDFIKGAGGASSLATSVGQPVEQLPSAAGFVRAYASARFPQPYGAYGAQAYDAAGLLVAALGKVLPGAGKVAGARGAVLAAVNATTGYRGATGETTFDEFGDTSNLALTVYEVRHGRWVAVTSGRAPS
jgi:branched-chain amino acid transport system substrate-binding protein